MDLAYRLYNELNGTEGVQVSLTACRTIKWNLPRVLDDIIDPDKLTPNPHSIPSCVEIDPNNLKNRYRFKSDEREAMANYLSYWTEEITSIHAVSAPAYVALIKYAEQKSE